MPIRRRILRPGVDRGLQGRVHPAATSRPAVIAIAWSIQWRLCWPIRRKVTRGHAGAGQLAGNGAPLMGQAPAAEQSGTALGFEPGAALEAQALVRRFGATRALDGLSFTVGRGQLFGLVGADGPARPRLFARWPASSRWTRAARWCWAAIRRKAGLPCASRSGSCLNRRADPDLSVGENLRSLPACTACRAACFVSVRRACRDHAPTAISRPPRRCPVGRNVQEAGPGLRPASSPRRPAARRATNGVDPVSRRELWACCTSWSTTA